MVTRKKKTVQIVKQCQKVVKEHEQKKSNVVKNVKFNTFQPKCFCCEKLGHLANDKQCPGW